MPFTQRIAFLSVIPEGNLLLGYAPEMEVCPRDEQQIPCGNDRKKSDQWPCSPITDFLCCQKWEPQISPLRFAPVEMTNRVRLAVKPLHSRYLLVVFAFLSVIPEGNLLFRYAPETEVCPRDEQQIPCGNDRKKSDQSSSDFQPGSRSISSAARLMRSGVPRSRQYA